MLPWGPVVSFIFAAVCWMILCLQFFSWLTAECNTVVNARVDRLGRIHEDLQTTCLAQVSFQFEGQNLTKSLGVRCPSDAGPEHVGSTAKICFYKTPGVVHQIIGWETVKSQLKAEVENRWLLLFLLLGLMYPFLLTVEWCLLQVSNFWHQNKAIAPMKPDSSSPVS